MNYFGHAVVASLSSKDLEFVLGSMLPDLCSLAGVSWRNISSERLRQGIHFHHHTDSVFHDNPDFLETQFEVTLNLRAQGVRKGPSRAVGHIGTEFLLDGHLVDQTSPETYLDALRWGIEASEDAFGLKRSDAQRLQALLSHLQQRGLAVHAPTGERLRARLVGTLAGRPALTPSSNELTHAIDVLLAASPRISARALPLVHALHEQLVTRGSGFADSPRLQLPTSLKPKPTRV